MQPLSAPEGRAVDIQVHLSITTQPSPYCPFSLTLCWRTKYYYRLTLRWPLVVEGLRDNYDNTIGPAEYHSLGTVFIIMAIICHCKGFHTTLNRLSRKERNVVHAPHPWAETTPHRKPSVKEEIMWSSRYLPFRSSVKRQHYRLMLSQSGTLPSERIGRTSPPRSAASPMQPQQEETTPNVDDVSPPHAGKKPLYKKRDDEKRGRSKQLSQEAITLLSEKRKAGSGGFWGFFLLSSASSTAAAGDPAHTSLNIPHLAPTPHGASSFAHQPLRCCRTTTSSAT